MHIISYIYTKKLNCGILVGQGEREEIKTPRRKDRTAEAASGGESAQSSGASEGRPQKEGTVL